MPSATIAVAVTVNKTGGTILPAELATPGTTVHVGYFDQRIEAVVAEEPLFDPTMSRLRG